MPDFYDDAFNRIQSQSPESKEVAIKALTFVFYAQRLLRVDELKHVLIVEKDTTSLDEDFLYNISNVLEACQGLIHLEANREAVSLVHHTVSEYLKQNAARLLPDGEKALAAACLTYMNFETFNTGPCPDTVSLDDRLARFPLLAYASTHWGLHVRRTHYTGNDLEDVLRNDRKLEAHLQLLYIPQHRINEWHERYPRDVRSIHVVAFWGLDHMFAWALSVYRETDAINSRDSQGKTPLFYASCNGHRATVQTLLNQGADVDIRTCLGETPLHGVARSGDETIVQAILDHKPDITSRDVKDWAPLDWAISRGHNTMIRMLLDSGRDDSYMWNRALSTAAEHDLPDIISTLAENGFHVDHGADTTGATPLCVAVAAGNMSSVLRLLELGADPQYLDASGNCPMFWGLSHPEIIEILLARTRLQDIANIYGETPLMWCAAERQLATMRLLVSRQAELNSQDQHGYGALHIASSRGHTDIVRFLLEEGADPDLETESGLTPLHIAAFHRHADIVTMLEQQTSRALQILQWVEVESAHANKLAFYLDSTIGAPTGNPARTGPHYAAKVDHGEYIKNIFGQMPPGVQTEVSKSKALLVAAQNDSIEAFRILLEQGADPDSRDEHGWTALHHVSCGEGYKGVRLRMSRMLINAGCDVNATTHCWSPILLAAHYQAWSTVECLADAGAHINACNYHNRTVLHWAARNADPEAINCLLKHVADIDATDHWGMTPLMWSVQAVHPDVPSCLLKLGADVQRRAKHGVTALHMAVFKNDEDVINQLLDARADINARMWQDLTPLHVAILTNRRETARELAKRDADMDIETEAVLFTDELFKESGYDRAAYEEAENPFGDKMNSPNSMGKVLYAELEVARTQTSLDTRWTPRQLAFTLWGVSLGNS